MEISKQYNSIP